MHINNSNKHSSPYVNQQGREQHSRAFFGLDGFATSNMSDEQLTEPTGNLDYQKERQPQLPSNSSHQNERLKPRQRKQQHTSSTIPLNSNRRNDGENSRIIVQRQQQPIGAPISASSAPLGFLSFGISLAAMMIEHTQLLDQEDIQSYDTRVIIAFVMFFGGLLQVC